jgi:hypothetical protein
MSNGTSGLRRNRLDTIRYSVRVVGCMLFGSAKKIPLTTGARGMILIKEFDCSRVARTTVPGSYAIFLNTNF